MYPGEKHHDVFSLNGNACEHALCVFRLARNQHKQNKLGWGESLEEFLQARTHRQSTESLSSKSEKIESNSKLSGHCEQTIKYVKDFWVNGTIEEPADDVAFTSNFRLRRIIHHDKLPLTRALFVGLTC